MPSVRPLLLAAALGCLAATTACNNETPTTKVGSGSGETNNAGASSGRVPTPEQPAATNPPTK